MKCMNMKTNTENLLECGKNRYKKGDRVVFFSDQPDLILSKYADERITIKRSKHIGIIKDVQTVRKGFYLYSIVTTTLHFLCQVHEEDIVEKLPDE